VDAESATPLVSPFCVGDEIRHKHLPIVLRVDELLAPNTPLNCTSGGGEEIKSTQKYEGGGANNMLFGQAERRKRLSILWLTGARLTGLIHL